MTPESMIGNKFLSYTIKQFLGEGGMASVYLAENNLGKKFAVKVLKPELFGKEVVRQRFRNEAQLMVSLDHPNIRQVADWYEEDSLMVIVLEFLDGADLQTIIEKKGPLPEAQVVELYKQVLPAFTYTHQQGVVHRDIKPSNFFLTYRGQLKVLDYGIAKIRDLQVTQESSTLGSPLYMSPEQVKSPKNVTHLTDVYSLGVTLWVMLAGKKPYDEDILSLYDIQGKIVQEQLPKLPTISAQLNRVIEKATAKNPQDRFQSCEEFLGALSSKSMKSEGTIVDEEKKPSIRKSEHTLPDTLKQPTPITPEKSIEKPQVVQSIPTPPAPKKRSFMRSFLIFMSGAVGVFVILIWIGSQSKNKKQQLDDDDTTSSVPISSVNNLNDVQTDTAYFHSQRAIYEGQGYWIGPLVEGYAIIGKKDASQRTLYGFVDKDFREAIPLVYENLGNFKGGIAPAKYGGRWGAISPDNKKWFDFKFEILTEFNADGYAYVQNEGKSYYVDKNGNCVSYQSFTCN